MYVEVDEGDSPLTTVACIKEVSFECRHAGLPLSRITQVSLHTIMYYFNRSVTRWKQGVLIPLTLVVPLDFDLLIIFSSVLHKKISKTL